MFEEPTEPALARLATVTTHDTTVVVVADRYQVIRTLGQGGMGIVYEAWDRRLNRNVALKLIHPGDSHETGAATRLLREAQVMAALEHENVVSAYDVGTWDAQVYLAMQLVHGTTLRAWMKEPRSNPQKFAVLLGAGRGLVAAHERRIVHRDFKPDNVLVDTRGVARVTDFGIARQLDHTELSGIGSIDPLGNTQLTQSGAIIGTPLYMAPEQAIGSPVTAKADQYAFCATAWELFAGHRAFAGVSMAEVLSNKLSGEIVPTSTTEWPDGLAAILRRGLAREPSARYATLEELLGDLQEVATRRPKRARHPAWKIAGASGLVLSAGLVTWSVMPSAPSTPRAVQLDAPRDAGMSSLDAPIAREQPAVESAAPPALAPATAQRVAHAPGGKSRVPPRAKHDAPTVLATTTAEAPTATPVESHESERKALETALDDAEAARVQRHLLLVDIPSYGELRDQARAAAERGEYATASDLAAKARKVVADERIDAHFIELKTKRLSERAGTVKLDPDRAKQLQTLLSAVTSAAAADQYARANDQLTAVAHLLGVQ